MTATTDADHRPDQRPARRATPSSTGTTTSPGGSSGGSPTTWGSTGSTSTLIACPTDIPTSPASGQGGLKAPSSGRSTSRERSTSHPAPPPPSLEQVDLVHRMIERYPDQFALAEDADDVERAVPREGKIASLIGAEGGHAIENSLAALRTLPPRRPLHDAHAWGTIDWADSATDTPRHGGLTGFGEAWWEMNRIGMVVDISHVSADTMRDALRCLPGPRLSPATPSARGSGRSTRGTSRTPSSSRCRDNNGVCMVTFVPTFVSAAGGRLAAEERDDAAAAAGHHAGRLPAYSAFYDALRGGAPDADGHTGRRRAARRARARGGRGRPRRARGRLRRRRHAARGARGRHRLPPAVRRPGGRGLVGRRPRQADQRQTWE